MKNGTQRLVNVVSRSSFQTRTAVAIFNGPIDFRLAKTSFVCSVQCKTELNADYALAFDRQILLNLIDSLAQL